MPWTVSLWFRPEIGQEQTVWHSPPHLPHLPGPDHIVVGSDNMGRPYYRIGEDEMWSQVLQTFPILGEWHHIAIDGTNAYLDGTWISTMGNVVPGPSVSDLIIDELAIFDRELTLDEIIPLYNGGTPPDLQYREGLVGWWRYDRMPDLEGEFQAPAVEPESAHPPVFPTPPVRTRYERMLEDDDD